MYLFLLIILPFIAAFILYAVDRVKKEKETEVIAYGISIILLIMVAFAYGKNFSFSIGAGGFGPIVFRIDTLSWFFAIMSVGFFILNLVFNFSYYKERSLYAKEYFIPTFFILLGSIFGILFSKHLLSMFFFWEIMTWSSYLMASYSGKVSKVSSIRYVIMSIFGAYAFLVAIGIVFTKVGTLDISLLATKITQLSPGYLIFTMILFTIAFGVKAALMPLHTWAPFAYTEAPNGFTPFFSGILSKLGIFALFVSLFSLPLFKTISSIYKGGPFGLSCIFYIIALLGAITAFLGAIMAFFQDDAKKLLAFSSISQLGYIVTGLFIGTSLGVGGALFHALNHAVFKGMLFFAVASVIYRTKTRKLSEMGGLLPNMPITFMVVLGGIIALAGIPPSGGFASKWMLYEALIANKMIFMATLLFLATTASFMYVFRLIHSIFLGQRPVKFATLKEVPLPMQIVMLIFLFFAYIFGVFPGLVLGLISKILGEIGLAPINYTMTQVASPLGSWNAFWVFILLGWAFVIALLVFFFGAPSRKVSKLDTFASGEILGEDVPYHYSYYFYRPLEEVILPYLRISAHKLYESLSSWVVKGSGVIRLWYNGNLETYVLYFIIFICFVLIFSKLIV